MKKKYDLEDRLIAFSLNSSVLINKIEDTAYGKYIAGQLIRSSTSPALNYGEAQSAESPKDFIHKASIILKELRESKIALKIALLKPLVQDLVAVKTLIEESDELIAIFIQCKKTTEKRIQSKE